MVPTYEQMGDWLEEIVQQFPAPFFAALDGGVQLEEQALERINRLGIGPQGLGGRVSALAVHIEQYATHIAGLPCVVNMGCHITRHATAVL